MPKVNKLDSKTKLSPYGKKKKSVRSIRDARRIIGYLKSTSNNIFKLLENGKNLSVWKSVRNFFFEKYGINRSSEEVILECLSDGTKIIETAEAKLSELPIFGAENDGSKLLIRLVENLDERVNKPYVWKLIYPMLRFKFWMWTNLRGNIEYDDTVYQRWLDETTEFVECYFDCPQIISDHVRMYGDHYSGLAFNFNEYRWPNDSYGAKLFVTFLKALDQTMGYEFVFKTVGYRMLTQQMDYPCNKITGIQYREFFKIIFEKMFDDSTNSKK